MLEAIFMLLFFCLLSLHFTKCFFFLYSVFFDANSKSEISRCRSDLVLELFDFQIPITVSTG